MHKHKVTFKKEISRYARSHHKHHKKPIFLVLNLVHIAITRCTIEVCLYSTSTLKIQTAFRRTYYFKACVHCQITHYSCKAKWIELVRPFVGETLDTKGMWQEKLTSSVTILTMTSCKSLFFTLHLCYLLLQGQVKLCHEVCHPMHALKKVFFNESSNHNFPFLFSVFIPSARYIQFSTMSMHQKNSRTWAITTISFCTLCFFSFCVLIIGFLLVSKFFFFF